MVLDREQKNKERFLENVKNHQMILQEDNGLYRNLIFKQPNESTYWFGIQTWPGYLCIYGDMGTFVFSRIQDMFQFFRNDNLEINSGYWHEKLTSDSRYGGSKEFSKDKFIQHIKEDFDSHVESNELSEEEQKELWEEIEEGVLGHVYDGEYAAYDAAMRFTDKEDNYIFQEFYEHNCQEYTIQFIWCLYAIVWAIQQYDSLTNKQTSK